MSALLLFLSCSKPVPIDAAPAESDWSDRVAEFFAQVHADELSDDPVRAAYLGVPHDDTAWTSLSHQAAVARQARAKTWLEAARDAFAEAPLGDQDRLSVRLFERRQQREIESLEWFYHDYRINQMWGTHTWIPSFLMTVHQIDSEASARSWVARARAARGVLDELGAILAEQESRGILPPAFVYPHVFGAIEKLLAGAPFSEGPSSPLLAHFERQVADLELDSATRAALVRDARAALADDLGPAYAALVATLEAQAPTTDDGAWKLPDGARYYAHELRGYTTTDLGPEEIHELGLAEVARIQEEMRGLMPALGVTGDLPELFEHLRTAPQYTLPNTDEGRATYLDMARAYVAAMEARLPEAFDLLPEAPLEVRRVEPWREGSAGKAFYQDASLDGTRPGIFYANLRDTANMPTYQLEALVYHEGLPGHHMQNAVSMALTELPPFRRFEGYGAYGEGWGLYSEYLPKELGFYQDPASDAGRLAMELWRAARLVVDTGIHHHRWTRERAIEYLASQTPNPQGDCVHAIERYIVSPGQATGYKIGMLRILALREQARTTMGDQFSLTGFHRVVLGNGPLPLDVLEEQVNAWADR